MDDDDDVVVVVLGEVTLVGEGWVVGELIMVVGDIERKLPYC